MLSRCNANPQAHSATTSGLSGHAICPVRSSASPCWCHSFWRSPSSLQTPKVKVFWALQKLHKHFLSNETTNARATISHTSGNNARSRRSPLSIEKCVFCLSAWCDYRKLAVVHSPQISQKVYKWVSTNTRVFSLFHTEGKENRIVNVAGLSMSVI
jgi:hypothetical protein